MKCNSPHLEIEGGNILSLFQLECYQKLVGSRLVRNFLISQTQTTHYKLNVKNIPIENHLKNQINGNSILFCTMLSKVSKLKCLSQSSLVQQNVSLHLLLQYIPHTEQIFITNTSFPLRPTNPSYLKKKKITSKKQIQCLTINYSRHNYYSKGWLDLVLLAGNFQSL